MKKIFFKARNEYLHQSEKSFFYKMAARYLQHKNLILDMGCGLGNYLKLRSENTIGIDWNYKNLLQLKEITHPAYLIQGNVLSLPFSERTFDGIHCSHLIEHFAPQSAYTLLKEMDRVLSPGGIMVISAPLYWEGFYDDLTHVRPYSPTSILHYYTGIPHSRTMQKIKGEYRVIDIKYRYYHKKLEPLITSGQTLSTIGILFTKLLNYLGLRKWSKNGFTLVLTKIS